MSAARALRSLFSISAIAALAACDDATDTSSASTGSTAASMSTSSDATSSGDATTSGSMSSSSSSGSGGGGGVPTGTPYVYVGSSDGKIRGMKLDQGTGALSLDVTTVDTDNPSFMAISPDGKYLYAVDEGQNEVAAFAIGALGDLTPLNHASSMGNGPAHVAVDGTGKVVVAVNYGSGDLTAIPVNADGSLGTPSAAISTGQNAHQIVFDATNAFAFVPNKGSDNVTQLLFDGATLTKNAPANVALTAGSGPRHMTFWPGHPYAYVVRENDDAISVFAYANGKLGALVQEIGTLPVGVGGGNNTCAEIAVGKSDFLYASNRGNDSIAVFAMNPADGKLSLVMHQATGGQTPRHFSIDATGTLMLVGNQGSGTVAAFGIDLVTGKLTPKAVTTTLGPVEFVGIHYLK